MQRKDNSYLEWVSEELMDNLQECWIAQVWMQGVRTDELP